MIHCSLVLQPSWLCNKTLTCHVTNVENGRINSSVLSLQGPLSLSSNRRRHHVIVTWQRKVFNFPRKLNQTKTFRWQEQQDYPLVRDNQVAFIRISQRFWYKCQPALLSISPKSHASAHPERPEIKTNCSRLPYRLQRYSELMSVRFQATCFEFASPLFCNGLKRKFQNKTRTKPRRQRLRISVYGQTRRILPPLSHTHTHTHNIKHTISFLKLFVPKPWRQGLDNISNMTLSESQNTAQVIHKSWRTYIMIKNTPASDSSVTPRLHLGRVSNFKPNFSKRNAAKMLFFSLFMKNFFLQLQLSISASRRKAQFLEARRQKEAAEEQLRAMRKNKLFRRIQADLKERDKKRKPGASGNTWTESDALQQVSDDAHRIHRNKFNPIWDVNTGQIAYYGCHLHSTFLAVWSLFDLNPFFIKD